MSSLPWYGFAIQRLNQLWFHFTLRIPVTQLTFVPWPPRVDLFLCGDNNHMIFTHCSLKSKRERLHCSLMTAEGRYIIDTIILWNSKRDRSKYIHVWHSPPPFPALYAYMSDFNLWRKFYWRHGSCAALKVEKHRPEK